MTRIQRRNSFITMLIVGIVFVVVAFIMFAAMVSPAQADNEVRRSGTPATAIVYNYTSNLEVNGVRMYRLHLRVQGTNGEFRAQTAQAFDSWDLHAMGIWNNRDGGVEVNVRYIGDRVVVDGQPDSGLLTIGWIMFAIFGLAGLGLIIGGVFMGIAAFKNRGQVPASGGITHTGSFGPPNNFGPNAPNSFGPPPVPPQGGGWGQPGNAAGWGQPQQPFGQGAAQPQAQQPVGAVCNSCGSNVPPGARFCTSCGGSSFRGKS